MGTSPGAIDRKVHAETPARGAVLSILLSGTYVRLKQKGLHCRDGLVASMTGSEEALLYPGRSHI
jgi:hypothetical protein